LKSVQKQHDIKIKSDKKRQITNLQRLLSYRFMRQLDAVAEV